MESIKKLEINEKSSRWMNQHGCSGMVTSGHKSVNGGNQLISVSFVAEETRPYIIVC